MNRLRTLRADLPAGVTAAAVVIPQAMAYATIAGLPVQAGLYTAIVPLFVYSLVGTSRPLSVSTTSTIAALTAAALAAADVETDGDAIRAVATLAVLTGVFLLAAGAFKLGFLADFISLPVLAGFKAGTGLLIISGQLGKVLGIDQTGDRAPVRERVAAGARARAPHAGAGRPVRLVATREPSAQRRARSQASS